MKLVYALLALTFVSCAKRPVTHGVPADFCLTFARNGCLGHCPVYHMTIDARGNVAFTGDMYTSVVGEHDRRMSADDVKNLIASIDAIDFFELTDHQFGPRQCGTRWTDSSSVCMILRMNGRSHTVRHYLGCDGFSGQKELLAFEDRIDALAGVEPWKKSDERLEQIRRDGASVLQPYSLRFVREVRGTLSSRQLRELTAHVASIPRQDGIPFVEQAPDDLRSFENDQTFTREEWNALRLRLLVEKQDGVLNGAQFGSSTPVMLRVIASP